MDQLPCIQGAVGDVVGFDPYRQQAFRDIPRHEKPLREFVRADAAGPAVAEFALCETVESVAADRTDSYGAVKNTEWRASDMVLYT